MGQTIVEKIAQRHAVNLPEGSGIRCGDMLILRPFHVMTHDNTGAVIPKFLSIGAENIADPSQPVFALDHNVQDHSPENLEKYRRIEAFAAKQGVIFHPAGAGIGHQLMIENGFVHPGRMVVASDSHSNMYGALAALGTPVVRTDAAAIWAGGETWWQVPRSIRVILEGELQAGVTGKDVIITLCGLFNSGEVLNAALEFGGDGIQYLSMSERLTIANMTTEWGALTGWFPFDGATASFLRKRASVLEARGIGNRLNEEMIADWEKHPPLPDEDGEYAAEIRLDLSTVIPHVAGPDSVGIMQSISAIEKQQIPVDKAYLLSCVNGRLEDLEEAAEILDGQQLAPGVELYVAAASASIEAEARERGVWEIFEELGAHLLPPGCGACIGLGEGLLEADEVGISATNRNFKGRMGSRDARAYLGSPSVVAASALAGFISGPDKMKDLRPRAEYIDFGRQAQARPVEIREGFPDEIRGRVLYLPADNLNTDGIYGKDVTYRDDLTPEEMASHAMENYDPIFQKIAAEGDIIVAGRNFGTGSSREQAATALKYRGIQMVVAVSFSQTYLRNAFNNAFICLESPALSEALAQHCSSAAEAGERSIPAGKLRVDIGNSMAHWQGRSFPVSPLGPAAQELILEGGLEALTRTKLGL